jgi:uncharacterized membrane protein
VKLVEFLQGKWLGHPLHPAIVHVPIGAWLAACALDVASWAGVGGALLSRVALWCVIAGLVVAVFAIPPGVADWTSIKKEKPAWKIGLWHMGLNLAAALVWAVNVGLRLARSEPAMGGAGAPLPVLLTSLIATAIVLISAYLGSLMVFDHGIGVARFSKKKWRERAVRAGARVEKE